MLLGTIAEDPLKFYRGVREDFWLQIKQGKDM